MSIQPCEQPVCQTLQGSVETVIEPRARDLGGFEVRRVLPSASRRMVGPFIFFDEMGPAAFAPGTAMDVRPHPHIGLATLTWLFDGEILHRDSLGCVQPIRPGAVNWMTAGRGIVHSERTPPELRDSGFALHGIQSWIALPEADAETDPAFDHHPAGSLPVIERPDARLTLIAGDAFGQQSPVATFSSMFYLHAEADAGARIDLPEEYEERAVYVVTGDVDVDGSAYGPHRMLVFAAGARPVIRARSRACLMLLGGAPVGPRHIWWNFVSGSRARIEQAKADWREGRCAAVPGETDFIPLPAD
jgi:redox-sensitive bicupin YhaK (pirin superfamily)